MTIACLTNVRILILPHGSVFHVWLDTSLIQMDSVFSITAAHSMVLSAPNAVRVMIMYKGFADPDVSKIILKVFVCRVDKDTNSMWTMNVWLKLLDVSLILLISVRNVQSDWYCKTEGVFPNIVSITLNPTHSFAPNVLQDFMPLTRDSVILGTVFNSNQGICFTDKCSSYQLSDFICRSCESTNTNSQYRLQSLNGSEACVL